MKLETGILLGIAILAGGCAVGEPSMTVRPTAVRSERDIHASAMRSDRSALRAWEDASRRALRGSRHVAPSFSERIEFDRNSTQAAAYRVSLAQGQTLRVNVRSLAGSPDVFTDMFHVVAGDIFRPVHWSRHSSAGGTFVARSDGVYVLRVQPRIGAHGAYDLAVSGNSSLVFPVAGAGPSAIGSVFGDPRDNGAREHEGVDIFATRGTPVIAVADGHIVQARNTPVGGLVIWQEDAASSLTYYYAHLDELLVREGARVRAGDIIGRVGNSGNARGVRPHLHFAVYRPGRAALDPAPLLAGARGSTGRVGESDGKN